MGYLLKLKEEGKYVIKMFYSEPKKGFYVNDIMAVSREEYHDHYSKQDDSDFVFLEGWCDTSAELFSMESRGIDITIGTFVLDCILQGKGNELEYDKPYEFTLLL